MPVKQGWLSIQKGTVIYKTNGPLFDCELSAKQGVPAQNDALSRKVFACVGKISKREH